MKSILAAVAVTASTAALIAGGTPVSAQTYFPQYNSRPSNSFTGYSGTRYNVYTQKSNSSAPTRAGAIALAATSAGESLNQQAVKDGGHIRLFTLLFHDEIASLPRPLGLCRSQLPDASLGAGLLLRQRFLPLL